MNNKQLLGEYAGWAGAGAALLGVLIVLGLVHGRKWTEAHSVLAGAATVLLVVSQL